LNVLFVGAHHDDLEVSAGGTVKRWVEDGHQVFSAILTDSTWIGPDGIRYRDPDKVETYAQNAARILGYTQISLNYCHCFELAYSDNKVVDLLNIIDRHEIDTLITIWPHDAHRDHRMASEIARAATRRIPRVLLTKVSWNSTPYQFRQAYFVDITRQFETKRKALACFEDEFKRTGHLWERYIHAQGQLFGLEAGYEMAEGFEIMKFAY
jgi:LmbE family N-acetylglucosaminyl deacetylase